MSVRVNSYGTANDVAALTSRFTSDGSYTITTVPTLPQVEAWIDQISATLNVLLAEQGFAIPITQADCVMMLKNFVATQAADLCNYANSAGRYFSEKGVKTGPWAAIQKDAAEFIEQHAAGLAQLGATRTRAGLNGLAFCDSNDAGVTIEPIFSRDQFGTKNVDYDTE
jgi:hypothetical protein